MPLVPPSRVHGLGPKTVAAWVGKSHSAHVCLVMVVMKRMGVRDVLSEDRTQNSCSSYAVTGTPDKGAWPRFFIDIHQLCGLRQDTSPR